MEEFGRIVAEINSFVWGPWLLILLVGTHIYMTIRTGFIQRRIGLGIRLSVTRDKGAEGDVSQFGALTTSLASTIGTGNIVGVGTAIALGGPGALLWMWLTGVLGIATKYAEGLIAVKYRVKDENGMMIGGAMFALERGLKLKWLGVFFAIFTAAAAFGIGSGVQSNAVATQLFETFGLAPWISGVVIMFFVGLVILGGLKSIARVSEALVPFMAILYVLGCAVILCINGQYILPALELIITSAFNPEAAGGGALGFVTVKFLGAARYGVARGLFSNESGMGSAPIVSAAAQTKNLVRQALVLSTGAFWDTVVICTMTGLVIITSAFAHEGGLDMSSGGILARTAFDQIPHVGNLVLTFGLITFAFSTILGWSYYGEKGMQYIFGTKSIVPYRFVYVAVAFLGTVLSLDVVWDIADTLNALMTIPNMAALLLLSGVIAADTKKYLTGSHIDDVDAEPVPLWSDLKKKKQP
ncbi:MAG: sodium:alanine symporter family protein [Spirochaetota bacterium]|jgi:AGCS family alanine or glycine:cation symporter|nr:sodium:alanine symporter family protein [Spirochaetota bacterium]